MTDLAQWKLRGPVRTLREEHAEWDAPAQKWGAPRGLRLASFLPDGRLSESEFHNPDGSIAHWARLYDGQGRLVETQSWMNNAAKRRQLYSYDSVGRLTEVVDIAPDGPRKTAETSRYDQAGRKTTVRFLAVPQTGSAMAHGVEGSDVAYSVPGAVTSTTTYDDHDRPAEVSFHDAAHALITRIVLARDRDGRLLSETNYFEEDSPRFAFQTGSEGVPAEERAKLDQLLASVFDRKTYSSIAYAYDQHGRVLQRIHKMGMLSEERTNYRYDDYGNPIEESTDGNDRTADVSDGGSLRVVEEERRRHDLRFEYKYDGHGNWTERVVLGRTSTDAEAPFQPSNVTWRRITYYGP